MSPLWFELQLARNELTMWARLHESDENVYRALQTIDKAVNELRRLAEAP